MNPKALINGVLCSAVFWALILLLFFLAACTPQPNKLAPEPPYITQRPGFTETFLFGTAQDDSGVTIARPMAPEMTASGYLRDLEAE